MHYNFSSKVGGNRSKWVKIVVKQLDVWREIEKKEENSAPDSLVQTWLSSQMIRN